MPTFVDSGRDVAPELDPRLEPTPDYGTLGPGSDVANLGRDPNPNQNPDRNARIRRAQLLAALIGMFAALFAGWIRKGNPEWTDFGRFLSPNKEQPVSAKDLRQLDRLKPQKQAETLLEQAIGNTDGAAEQISSRVDRWQGKVHWSPQIATLTTAALNSNDMHVRESGVEVELAAYGLAKNSASLEYLMRTADSSAHARKIWALWALGLMANRGVETERVVERLAAQLTEMDSDEDLRRWAVEGLALSGSDAAVGILLKTMHDDPSPVVRERAACGVAASGMFTPQQRLTAVPQLLNYIDDASLDAQTHGWAFLALADITHQRLPNDAAAWRSWYEKQGVSGR